MKSFFLHKSLIRSDIRNAQKLWGKGIVEIGKAYKRGEDYKLLAEKFVDRHYGYQEGIVLFKPTLASVEQFRDTFEKAVSYFISGNEKYPEDEGFALRPWKSVLFKNSGIILIKKHAVAMGNYFFTDFDGHQVKVEYTFGYFQNEANEIKIHLHHSSMPFEIK